MKCTLNIPAACFNCPYPDCINDNSPVKSEKYFLEAEYTVREQEIIQERKKIKKKFQKQLDRHKQDRRAYFKEYAKKRRKRVMNDFADYVAQLDKEIEKRKKGYHDIDPFGMGVLMAKQLFLNCLEEMGKSDLARKGVN